MHKKHLTKFNTFYDKNTQQTEGRRKSPQHNKKKKYAFERPTANITLGVERLKAFLLRSGARQGCPLLPLFSSVLEVLGEQLDKRKNKRHLS